MSPMLAARTADRGLGTYRYQRHQPENTLLYQIVEQHYPLFVTYLARQDRPLPIYVQREFGRSRASLRSAALVIPFTSGISTLRSSGAWLSAGAL